MQHDLRHARFHQTFVHAKLTKAPNTNLLKLIWYSRTDTYFGPYGLFLASGGPLNLGAYSGECCAASG